MAIKDWRKLLRWKVHGRRYDEGRGRQGIELDDLVVLVELRRALVELTKAIWKRQRNRLQMPKLIDDDIDLRVQRFEGGSLEAEVSLGIPLHEHFQTSLIADLEEFDERDDVVETFFDAAQMLKSILHTKQLPNIPGFTPTAVGDMLKALEDRELRLELDVIGARRDVRFTPYLRPPAIRPGLLAIAAELAGEHLPEVEVVPPLFALLDHTSAIVREAAIYGLMHHDLRERSTVCSESSPTWRRQTRTPACGLLPRVHLPIGVLPDEPSSPHANAPASLGALALGRGARRRGVHAQRHPRRAGALGVRGRGR